MFCFGGEICMAKPAVSRNAFRGLFALYALSGHHENKPACEDHLLRLFRSSNNIPNTLLDLWSDHAELIGPDAVGAVLTSGARAIIDGRASYDHASQFLHAMLKELDQRRH